MIEYVVWSLFNSPTSRSEKPNHILCHGLDRSVSHTARDVDSCRIILPGVLEKYENVCRKSLESNFWRRLMNIMGADGDIIFTTLLLDCGLFVMVEPNKRCYHQISGVPLHHLCLSPGIAGQTGSICVENKAKRSKSCRRLSDITLIRSRILYSRPFNKPVGGICFGLKTTHVLNRLVALEVAERDLVLSHYIFPRQFGLDNVFTSKTDKKENVQAHKDYTWRTDVPTSLNELRRAVPRRLRGRIAQLVHGVRRRHEKIAYHSLLVHYCPVGYPASQQSRAATSLTDPILDLRHPVVSQNELKTQTTTVIEKSTHASTPSTDSGDTETAMYPFATPQSQIVAFCQAALKQLLPRDSFGTGKRGVKNYAMIMDYVSHFIHMRRHESMSMHELTQGLCLKTIEWLVPDAVGTASKISVTDREKRMELLCEFVYFVFDGLLLPLIATNFYVTESGVHRNRLFFFRHDVWSRLCLPSLQSLKTTFLETASVKRLQKMGSSSLGYSTVRFLPKAAGLRMISNLGRRLTQNTSGKSLVTQSINSRLSPLFSILNDERRHAKESFSRCAFSVGDLQSKLKSFQACMRRLDQPSVYFAKVDIQSAFDSIPQTELLNLMESMIQSKEYLIHKYAECRVLGSHGQRTTSVRFKKNAKACTEAMGLTGPLLLGPQKTGAVYSDIDQSRVMSREQALALMREHISDNTIQIGKKYYRQSRGIAQGSVLSGLLCTIFYTDFEEARLSFLKPESTILLRVLDDFLLISRDQSQAVQFVEAMKAGDEAYGISIHPQKSLVNFDMTIDGVQVPRIADTDLFPFCGILVDVNTLQISKNRVRKDNVIANTLTVDRCISVGKRLNRRILSSLHIQLQRILLDRGQNGKARVVQTLGECFMESTMKLHRYVVSIPCTKRPTQEFLIKLAQQLSDLAYNTIRAQQTVQQVGMTHKQVSCIAAVAMLRVLEKRRSLYGGLITWLEEVKQNCMYSLSSSAKTLNSVTEQSFMAVQHYVY